MARTLAYYKNSFPTWMCKCMYMCICVYKGFLTGAHMLRWRGLCSQWLCNYRTVSWVMEKAMAPHSSTLAWKIPWAEEPCRLQSMGSQRVRHDWATSLSRIGEGNGNPHQCSCLENPRDGEPGRLPSMGLHRVGHNWSDLAAAVAA